MIIITLYVRVKVYVGMCCSIALAWSAVNEGPGREPSTAHGQAWSTDIIYPLVPVRFHANVYSVNIISSNSNLGEEFPSDHCDGASVALDEQDVLLPRNQLTHDIYASTLR
jgi:hypothetical protein